MNSKITKISQSKRLKASDYEYFGICVFGFSIEVSSRVVFSPILVLRLSSWLHTAQALKSGQAGGD
jgi:hypothetical protein